MILTFNVLFMDKVFCFYLRVVYSFLLFYSSQVGIYIWNVKGTRQHVCFLYDQLTIWHNRRFYLTDDRNVTLEV